MVIALVLCLLAVLALMEAHFGEWRIVHWDFSDEFPNHPDSDHGFRLMKLYWMTHGSQCVLLASLLWVLAWPFFLTAAIRRSDSLRHWTGISSTALHGFLILYCVWLLLR